MSQRPTYIRKVDDERAESRSNDRREAVNIYDKLAVARMKREKVLSQKEATQTDDAPAADVFDVREIRATAPDPVVAPAKPIAKKSEALVTPLAPVVVVPPLVPAVPVVPAQQIRKAAKATAPPRKRNRHFANIGALVGYAFGIILIGVATMQLFQPDASVPAIATAGADETISPIAPALPPENAIETVRAPEFSSNNTNPLTADINPIVAPETVLSGDTAAIQTVEQPAPIEINAPQSLTAWTPIPPTPRVALPELVPTPRSDGIRRFDTTAPTSDFVPLGQFAANVVVHFPNSVPDAEVTRLMQNLDALVATMREPRRTGLTISETNVRYFNVRDAAKASVLATALNARLRDFTSFQPKPAEGLIEIWIASGTETSGIDAPPTERTTTAPTRTRVVRRTVVRERRGVSPDVVVRSILGVPGRILDQFR